MLDCGEFFEKKENTKQINKQTKKTLNNLRD